MPVTLRVAGGDALADLSRDLRAAGTYGQGLTRELKKNLREAAKPLQRDVKQAARSLPAHGRKHTGLRRAIANATRIQVSTAVRNARVRVWVDPSKMPAGQQHLPARMEGEGRWRHPVYGNRERWVNQQPHPYFEPVVERRLSSIRAAVLAALNDTANKIERGS